MILGIIIGAVAGFILGALVYRSNNEKADEIIAKIKELESKIK